MTEINSLLSSQRAATPAVALLRDPRGMLALGFGAGLSPVAPGTVGTVVAVPLWWLLAALPLWAYALTVAVLFILGVDWCGYAARRMGRGDPRQIVWDEVVGFLIAMIGAEANWRNALCGFVLFRLFDILKPWPICQLDRNVGGGLGIMADDAVAGVITLALLFVANAANWLAAG